MPSAFTYKGFKIISRLSDDGLTDVVQIYDPAFKKLPPAHETTSLDLAMKWVDKVQS